MKLNEVEEEQSTHTHTQATAGKNGSMIFKKQGLRLFSLFWELFLTAYHIQKNIIILGIEQNIYF